MKILVTGFCCLLIAGVLGCSPEVGSEDWCNVMNEKAKGDWTANEAGSYAEHCIFR